MLLFDIIIDAEALTVALTGYSGDVLGVNTNSLHTNTLCILYLYCGYTDYLQQLTSFCCYQVGNKL